MRFRISQGTISIFFGCHSIIHSILVWISWKRVYGKHPEFWQVICIFIHDIGHWKKDYLDDYSQKEEHWKFGAHLANLLFDTKGFLLVAGHCSFSKYPISELRFPDKYSWTIAPVIWLWSNCIFEPKLVRPGMTKWQSAKYWKETMKIFIKDEKYKTQSAHQIYLDQFQNKKG